VPIVLAAAYMLRLFAGMMQGPEHADLPEREDMSVLEMAALAPLVVAIVLIGLDPGPLTTSAAASLRASVASLGPGYGTTATVRYTAAGKTYESRTP
jgi:NADH-quinone oxidoreductase subunit M